MIKYTLEDECLIFEEVTPGEMYYTIVMHPLIDDNYEYIKKKCIENGGTYIPKIDGINIK